MPNLNSKGLRTGFTTGSCAAAAAKAAARALVCGLELTEVTVNLPRGGKATLKVARIEKENDFCRAYVTKDAGDDPDVTHGLTIVAEVSLAKGDISVVGGTGIGIVTKPGLAVPVGESAINPVPRQMIIDEVKKELSLGLGAKVTISAPGGEAIAAKTMNPRLGILGGISILGTGGIVRPMSEEDYRHSLVPQIQQALALGYHSLVLTPGLLGVKKALELGIPQEAVIETSNFIGFMLEECAKRPVKGIILFGHLGKMVKVAAGIFHTLGKLADARRETITAYAALAGASQEVVFELMNMNTAEESVEILERYNLTEVFNRIAAAASLRASQYTGEGLKIGTAMYSLSGKIVGMDAGAREVGGELGWKMS